MIFSDDGLVKIEGHPLSVIGDLSCAISSMKDCLLDAGFSENEANSLIALAGRVAFEKDLNQEKFDEIAKSILPDTL